MHEQSTHTLDSSSQLLPNAFCGFQGCKLTFTSSSGSFLFSFACSETRSFHIAMAGLVITSSQQVLHSRQSFCLRFTTMVGLTFCYFVNLLNLTYHRTFAPAVLPPAHRTFAPAVLPSELLSVLRTQPVHPSAQSPHRGFREACFSGSSDSSDGPGSLLPKAQHLLLSCDCCWFYLAQADSELTTYPGMTLNF